MDARQRRGGTAGTLFKGREPACRNAAATRRAPRTIAAPAVGGRAVVAEMPPWGTRGAGPRVRSGGGGRRLRSGARSARACPPHLEEDPMDTWGLSGLGRSFVRGPGGVG